mmetsp:Transcript_32883/g.83015  ORF Transcript_32883/g.83015 Transcript_32883/m.83015 type:complete len:161 (-) Transcript_32883:1009-1491(-)
MHRLKWETMHSASRRLNWVCWIGQIMMLGQGMSLLPLQHWLDSSTDFVVKTKLWKAEPETLSNELSSLRRLLPSGTMAAVFKQIGGVLVYAAPGRGFLFRTICRIRQVSVVMESSARRSPSGVVMSNMLAQQCCQMMAKVKMSAWMNGHTSLIAIVLVLS